MTLICLLPAILYYGLWFRALTSDDAWESPIFNAYVGWVIDHDLDKNWFFVVLPLMVSIFLPFYCLVHISKTAYQLFA